MSIVIGLTGSIGMGKSTTGAMFTQLEIPVSGSDIEVHDLLSRDEALIREVAREFPEARGSGEIDRRKLGATVFEDPQKLRRLEEILHPQVLKRHRAFIQKNKHEKMVVLDIPLLFEAKFENLCDYTIVVKCDEETQRKRVLARPGMTEERFQKIQTQQMSPSEKAARGDYILETGEGKGHTFRELVKVLKSICEKEGVEYA